MNQVNIHKLEYTIVYEKPVGVNEFTSALNALNSEYQKFIVENYGGQHPNATLNIEQIDNCCIKTTLVEVVTKSVLPFMGDVNTIKDFGLFLKLSYDFLTGNIKETEKALDSKDLNNLQRINEPSIHNGATVNINIIGNKNEVVLPVYTADEFKGRAVRDKIKELKNEDDSKTKSYNKVPLIFDQLKSNIDNTKGNRGIIREISPEARLITWHDDNDKKRMLKQTDENPLMMIFIVDVEVNEVSDKIKLYKILKLHETLHQ